MPASSTRNTLTRQWELLKMLPAKNPGATATALQKRLADAGHETSKRTVERDLVELSRLFPLQCNDKSVPYGWYWAPGRSADLPGITLSDALTLMLVEDSIRPLIPALMLDSLEPRFRQARQKLHALHEENPSAQWLDKVASVRPELNLIAPQISDEVLESAQLALQQNKQLKVSYYSPYKKDGGREHCLNLLGLVQRGAITYLVAVVEPHSDIRLFAMHRIVSATLGEGACNKPAGFSLAGYIASGAFEFGRATSITLQAQVSSQLASLLRETPLSHDMRLTEIEGRTLLVATVRDTWELRWWILSKADGIQILQPEALREEIVGQLRNALAGYAELDD